MTALKSYLDYYCDRHKPGYAVLVTGPWGVGKTFQVREALKGRRFFYVSLFGLQSPADIYSAVFATMYPDAAKLKKKADANRTVSVGGVPVGEIASNFVGMFIREQADTEGIVIFDDLERCNVPASDLLGVINRYVEHHGCRVIVITHEGELSDGLIKQREKIFGQTIRVQPQVETAYSLFFDTFGTDAGRAVLTDLHGDIIKLFHESGVESLRILRHVLEDCNRLADCIEDKHRANKAAMRELFLLFAALDFERRGNRLEPPDLEERNQAEFHYYLASKDEKATKSAMVEAIHRYTFASLESSILPDQTLKEMLFDGVFDAAAIRAALSNSSYFAEAAELPAWQVVIEFNRREDGEVEAARRTLETEFETRAVVDPGAMLHTFALRFMMAARGILEKNADEIAAECRSYIDDLGAAGKLLPPRPTRFDIDELMLGHGGQAYWVEESYREQFISIAQYLDGARSEAVLASLPDAAPEILKAVEGSSEDFVGLVTFTAKGHMPKYAEVPVFKYIPPTDFVASWMRSHPQNWHPIQTLLEQRVRQDRLAGEVPWLREVARLMGEEADRAGGLRALRIRRHTPRVPD